MSGLEISRLKFFACVGLKRHNAAVKQDSRENVGSIGLPDAAARNSSGLFFVRCLCAGVFMQLRIHMADFVYQNSPPETSRA